MGLWNWPEIATETGPFYRVFLFGPAVLGRMQLRSLFSEFFVHGKRIRFPYSIFFPLDFADFFVMDSHDMGDHAIHETSVVGDKDNFPGPMV